MVYTEDQLAVIERYAIEHHLNANDTQLSDDIPITSVGVSINAAHTWCSSKRLKLNQTKSEIIWFAIRASLKRLQHTDLSLHVGTVAIKPTSVVRDIGVLLDSELAMRQHIGKLTGLCYHHLRRLKKVRRVLSHTIT